MSKNLNDLVEHALISFSCDDVMTFLGRKMHHVFSGEIVSDKNRWPQGLRIKHKMKKNSLKMYDKCSVLRIETTINDPHEFKILKEVTCHGEKAMKWVPMGKSVVNLILVKAYPQPSKKYGESVCTAGITPSGKWIRLYPVDFRNLPIENKFEKWRWIEASITKSSDPRPESHKINHDTIVNLHKVETHGDWKQRRAILLPLSVNSLEELQELHDLNKTSLGIIKPKHIDELVIERTSSEWSKEKQEALDRAVSQQSLFSIRKVSLKSLEKVPYKFSYKFTCDNPSCKGHIRQILDWEINQSFRKWKREYGSEEIALDKIHEKYFVEFTEKRDLYFIMGTLKSMDRFRQFSIIGLVYPPKEEYEQLVLF